MKFQGRLFAIPVILLFLLTSCDSCNPTGVRSFGIASSGPYSDEIIAAVPVWGPCEIKNYWSSDSGTTWSAIDFSGTFTERIISGDCTESCKFVDYGQEQIHYRILPGKVLLRSFDGGKTWQDELHISAWSELEKLYVRETTNEMGSTPADIRGPFGAITDPTTGRLFVAMGIEGVLVGSPDNQWTWVDVDGFKKRQPSRTDMLDIIPLREWLRGPIIALTIMLLGLLNSTRNRINFHSRATIIIAISCYIIPFDLYKVVATFPLYLLFPNIPNESFFEWMPFLIIGALMFSLISVHLRMSSQKDQDQLKKFVIISTISMFSYWLGFLLWCQGVIFTEKNFVLLFNLGIFITALLYIRFIKGKTISRDISGNSTPI